MIERFRNCKERASGSDYVKDKMKINLCINTEGKCNDTYWSDEFPKAIEWLFLT